MADTQSPHTGEQVTGIAGIKALCAWPYASDDQVIHNSKLASFTVGDLREMLARQPEADCEDCAGTGYSQGVIPTEDMRGEYDATCEVCLGTGKARQPEADEIERLRHTVEYLTGVPSPWGVLDDYRSAETDAAILRCRERGDNEAAEIIGLLRIQVREARGEEEAALKLRQPSAPAQDALRSRIGDAIDSFTSGMLHSEKINLILAALSLSPCSGCAGLPD